MTTEKARDAHEGLEGASRPRTIRLLAGTAKNDVGHTVVLTDEAHKFLWECLKGRRAEGAMFTWAGQRQAGGRFPRTWKALIESAGPSNLLVLDLRRSAVRRMFVGNQQHVDP